VRPQVGLSVALALEKGRVAFELKEAWGVRVRLKTNI